MTTYQSQAVTTKDRDGNELTFKTLNLDGEEAVLAAAVDVELPDGQQVTVNVLYDSSDVAGLQAYLHDNFGGRGAGSVSQTEKDNSNAEYFRSGWVSALKEAMLVAANGHDPIAWAQSQMRDDETLPAQPSSFSAEVWDSPTFTPSEAGPVPNFGGWTYEPHAVPQRGDTVTFAEFDPALPVLCNRTDQHHHMRDHTGAHEIHPGTEAVCPSPLNHYPILVEHGAMTAQTPQNDAGAATPLADTQGAANTPQSGVPAPDQSAAESATGAGTPAAAPASTSDEKPKRKRRLKVEKAYDDALKVWKEGKGDSVADGQTLSEAYEALKAKDPGNSRLVQTVPAANDPQFPQPEQGVPATNYQQQMAHPINQEFATWASNLPGEHVGEDVIMTPQQASEVTAFAPGQTPQLGQVSITPEEQQAASGFPCPVQSSDGRPCQRPYGHELQTATNPEPKPHVYATVDPSSLGQQPWAPAGTVNDHYLPAGQQPAPVTDPMPWSPAGQELAFGSGGGRPVDSGQLSFQVPPTPAAAPHPETNFQPPAPAAPSWAEPV